VRSTRKEEVREYLSRKPNGVSGKDAPGPERGKREGQKVK